MIGPPWLSAALCLTCLLLALPRSTADAGLPDDSYDLPTKDYNSNGTYDDSFDEFAWGGEADAADTADDNNYYGDDFDTYYDMAGTYADPYGSDYFFEDPNSDEVQCTEAESGKAQLTGEGCDLKIKGADKLADKLTGGVDGTYKLSGCFEGWPKYLRQGKKGARTLFFSSYFNDWDISEGTAPNETALLVFGGGSLEFTRPNAVPGDQWHLSSQYMSERNDTDVLNTFPHINLTVECADGKEIDTPLPPVRSTQSLLTDEEADSKYRDIYTQTHEETQQPATINFFMVMSVLVAGMGVVMGLPYLLFKKKGAPGASWAQQLEDSRKKRVGHVS